MGRGSTQPHLAGNLDVLAGLFDATTRNVVAVVSDSILFNMDKIWDRHLPTPWGGAAFRGNDLTGNESGLPIATQLTCQKSIFATAYTSFTGLDNYTGDVNEARTCYSPGLAVEKKYTANHANVDPAYANRHFIIDQPVLDPTSFGLTDRTEWFRDGVDHLSDHPFTIRAVFVKGPWADPVAKLTLNLFRWNDLTIWESAPFSQYAATPAIGYAELSIPAMSIANPHKRLGLAVCGKSGTTSTINTVVNLIGVLITPDDVPGGTVIWDCCEGGTRLLDTVTKTTTLAWQAAAAMKVNNVYCGMAANGGYADAPTVTAAAQTLAAMVRVPTPAAKMIYAIGAYDLAQPADALPNNLTIFEEGYTAAANADPSAAFLNNFGRGPTHANGMYDGFWTPGDEVHLNTAGRIDFMTAQAGLLNEARATADSSLVADLLAAMNADPPRVNVVMVNDGPATLDTGGGAGGTGAGDFAVDHDGGVGVTVDGVSAAADCMRFTASGVGVDNVELAAFLKADYDAGARGAVDRRGTTYTGSDGRWEAPLMLDDGTYTVVASKGGYLIRTLTVVVP